MECRTFVGKNFAPARPACDNTQKPPRRARRPPSSNGLRAPRGDKRKHFSSSIQHEILRRGCPCYSRAREVAERNRSCPSSPSSAPTALEDLRWKGISERNPDRLLNVLTVYSYLRFSIIEPFQSSDHDKYHMYLTIHYNKNDSHFPFPTGMIMAYMVYTEIWVELYNCEHVCN